MPGRAWPAKLALFTCVALAACFVPRPAAGQPAVGAGKPTRALPDPHPFGVFLDLRALSDAAVDQALSRAAGIGFQSVRGVLDWGDAEPERGRFDFRRYDRFVREARARGLDVMLTISFSPPWDAGYRGESIDARAKMMPNDLKAWSRFVFVAVSRYKKEVQCWQIWEPPSFENFRGTDLDYRNLLVAAHAAAKRANPDAIIFASDPGGPDLGFVAALFGKRTAASFEGIALAPRVDRPEQLVEYLRAIQNEIMPKENRKILFITGWGYPVTATAPLELEAERRAQADFAVRAYVSALANHVDRIFWNGLPDDKLLEPPATAALREFFSRVDPKAGFALYHLAGGDALWISCRGYGGEGRALVWSPGDPAKLPLDASGGETPRLEILPLAGPADQAIDSDKPVDVGGEPLLITNVQAIPAPFKKSNDWLPNTPVPGPVCLRYALSGGIENGLYAKKYERWRKADPTITFQRGVPAADLTTETDPFLYADVDDRYVFFNRGESPIRITVTASARDPALKSGFNILYDSPRGYVFSRWVAVSPAAGWKDYTITLSDANFANKGGFDFRLSDLGSDQDVYVSRICVEKLKPTGKSSPFVTP